MITDTNSPNVDPNEITKFSALSSQWWDPSGELKTLHDINPLRLDYIHNKIPLQGKKIIDIGCGGGLLTEGMALLGADVTGIDLSIEAIEVAKSHQLEKNLAIQYYVLSAESMAISHANQFDIVTCLEMLEHVPDPESVIKACSDLLKPGGSLFLSTLSRNIKSYFEVIIGAEYLLKLLPQGTHDFGKFIKPSELAGFCRNAGLVLQDTTGISYQLFTKKYSLSKDTSVHYLMMCKKEQILS